MNGKGEVASARKGVISPLFGSENALVASRYGLYSSPILSQVTTGLNVVMLPVLPFA